MPKTFASSGLTNSQDRGAGGQEVIPTVGLQKCGPCKSHTNSTDWVGCAKMMLLQSVVVWNGWRVWGSWKRGEYDQNTMYEILKKLIKNILKKKENKKAKIKSV